MEDFIARIAVLLMILITRGKMEKKEYNYGDGYFQKLFIENGKIEYATCKCKWGEIHKDAWKNGQKICKHLECSIKEYYLEVRNKKKKKEKMIGPMRCPEWLKLAYKKAVEFVCEDCRNVFSENELEIHRIIQGYKGGTYRPGNVKVLCKKCHCAYAEDW